MGMEGFEQVTCYGDGRVETGNLLSGWKGLNR